MTRRSPGKGRYQYVLGDSSTEAARLRRQAELWDPHAHALFDRIGVKRGWKVLEVGPGQGSLHLELRHRVRGPVDAVERSPVFAEELLRNVEHDGFGAGRVWVSDLIETELPPAHYDFIFARWVFLFLPDPLSHLRKLVRALRPGGVIAIQDYLRETLQMVPRPPEWDAFLAADRAFFASQGGNVSIGAGLPDLFSRAGLRAVEATPHLKSGRPGDAVWSWLSDYFLGVMDRYAEQAEFGRTRARSLARKWKAAERSPARAFIVAPTVIDVVGRKPR